MGRLEGRRSLDSKAWLIMLCLGRVTRWDSWIGSTPLYTIYERCQRLRRYDGLPDRHVGADAEGERWLGHTPLKSASSSRSSLKLRPQA